MAVSSCQQRCTRTKNVVPELRRFLPLPSGKNNCQTHIGRDDEDDLRNDLINTDNTGDHVVAQVALLLGERRRWTHFVDVLAGPLFLSLGNHAALLKMFREQGRHFFQDPADCSRESVVGPLALTFPWRKLGMLSRKNFGEVLLAIRELGSFPVWLGERGPREGIAVVAAASRRILRMGTTPAAATRPLGEEVACLLELLAIFVPRVLSAIMEKRLVSRITRFLGSAAVHRTDWIPLLAAGGFFRLGVCPALHRQLLKAVVQFHKQIPNRVVFRYLMHVFLPPCSSGGRGAPSSVDAPVDDTGGPPGPRPAAVPIVSSLLSLRELRILQKVLSANPRRKEPRRTKSSSLEKDLGRVLFAITKERAAEQVELFPFNIDYLLCKGVVGGPLR